MSSIQENLSGALPLKQIVSLVPGPRRKHYSTVFRWVDKGVRGVKLPAFRVGSQILVRPEDLEAFLERLNDGPVDTPAPVVSTRARKAKATLDALGY